MKRGCPTTRLCRAQRCTRTGAWGESISAILRLIGSRHDVVAEKRWVRSDGREVLGLQLEHGGPCSSRRTGGASMWGRAGAGRPAGAKRSRPGAEWSRM